MSRHAKKPLPTETFEAHIEGLSHDGRGVAHLDGKTVFVAGGLPGEDLRFRYTCRRSRFDEGEAGEILRASPERVEPGCMHFGVCGGCSLQHLHADAQLRLKQATLLEQFQHLGGVSPAEVLPPLTGPLWGYRRRARLGVKYVQKKAKLLVGFREKRSHFLAELESCAVLEPAIGTRILELRDLLEHLDDREHIAQIEAAVGDNAAALVLRNLRPLGELDTQRLIAYAQQTGLHLYLQPGGLDSITPLWPVPAPPLVYRLDGDLHFEFGPSDFVQVNAAMNHAMLKLALALLAPRPEDRVLELFCGLGNFTLPLARRAAQVTAVEGDAGLVARAQANARRHGLENIRYVTADLAAADLQQDWLRAGYDKIFLDPPRTGALEIIRQLDYRGARRIVYVSCNPATLARDAGELVKRQGFELLKAGVMDMFPHTAHVESIALFER